VRALVDRHRALAAQREARIERLDAQLVELNQTRRDAAKRIDELIVQLDGVQAEVERRLSPGAAPE
jgi:hypothetical protein